MSVWDQFPEDYRLEQVKQINQSALAGDCIALVGLSGSGKSNLLGFMAHRKNSQTSGLLYVLIDCNRLSDHTPEAFFHLVRQTLNENSDPNLNLLSQELVALEEDIERLLSNHSIICLLLDRFDAVMMRPGFDIIAGNLRALRDKFKYKLIYLTATRKLIHGQTEITELFIGNTIWLGVLSPEDAFWSVDRDRKRFAHSNDRNWSNENLTKLIDISWGYPAFLRAACEAYLDGAPAEQHSIGTHPAVIQRIEEFWIDEPSETALQLSGILGHPWLRNTPQNKLLTDAIDTRRLTSKENLLIEYLISNVGQVCEKDQIIQAVWPEDVIFEEGVRDDSLAQLVRRLRVKIETTPGEPQYIHTVPGRGYLFRY